jgi:hypothetical protein
MKRNARLYLPWPIVSAFLAWVASSPAEAQTKRHGMLLACVERLDGGCLLYRLSAENQPAGVAERR